MVTMIDAADPVTHPRSRSPMTLGGPSRSTETTTLTTSAVVEPAMIELSTPENRITSVIAVITATEIQR
jgi:hypothetical protein